MLLLAATKMRQMKMAEPSMPTAHTSGSALWVRRRHQRVAPAPVTTPRKPVKQVMAPKMRLSLAPQGGLLQVSAVFCTTWARCR